MVKLSSNIDKDMILQSLLKELGIPENAARLYTVLLEKGPCSAKHLAVLLGIPRPSAYDQLNVLIERGLVTERQEEGRKIFQIEDPNHLPQLVGNKIERLENERKHLEEVLPSLLSQSAAVEPRIKFYSGAQGVRQALNQVLLYRDIKTLSMWPIERMTEILGEGYFQELDQKRIKQKIQVRGIWPDNGKKDLHTSPFLNSGGEQLREVRVAPPRPKLGHGLLAL